MRGGAIVFLQKRLIMCRLGGGAAAGGEGRGGAVVGNLCRNTQNARW
jgi:hypothetical protein